MYRTLTAVSIALLITSCSFVPINNQYEKAGTLKKGNIEFSGNATGNGIIGGGESESINNNVGLRIGYGISDKFDLKIRYERLMPTSSNTDGFEGANYFSVVPKLALVPEKLSLLLPVSRYSYKDEYVEGKQNLTSFAPQVLYTITSPKRTRDVTFGFKTDFLFSGGKNDELEGGGGVIPGFTVGAGFSKDLSKWALRPELGFVFLGGGAFINYGVGLQFIIPGTRKTAASDQ